LCGHLPERGFEGREFVSQSWPDNISGSKTSRKKMIESFPEVVREEGVQDWIDAAGIDTFVVIGVVRVVVVVIGVVRVIVVVIGVVKVVVVIDVVKLFLKVVA